MIAAIVKWGIFLFFTSSTALAQPPDEEILFHFNNRLDILKDTYAQLENQTDSILKGTATQKGFCDLAEKHTDFQRFANLILEKLPLASYGETEFRRFTLAIKTELANHLVHISKHFTNHTFGKLEIKQLHPNYVLIKILEENSHAEIIFLSERKSSIYPILDILNNRVSLLATLQLNIQDFLKVEEINSLSTVTEYLNSKNSSTQNFGLCDF